MHALYIDDNKFGEDCKYYTTECFMDEDDSLKRICKVCGICYAYHLGNRCADTENIRCPRTRGQQIIE